MEKECAASQRRYEEALRESNARLVGVLESATDGLFTLGADWRFTYLNSQAERLLRSDRQDVLNGSFWLHFPDKLFRNMFEHAASAHFSTWLEMHEYPSEAGVSVFFHDITGRRQAEEKIRRTAQEKEVLLREVHHRVKNSLQIVSSMLRLQARAVDKASEFPGTGIGLATVQRVILATAGGFGLRPR